MIYQFAKRMMKETDKRLLWKLAFNFGYKGCARCRSLRSVSRRAFISRRFCLSRSSIRVSFAARGAGWMWKRRGR